MQRYEKKMTYANLYAIFDAEVHEETSKNQSIFFAGLSCFGIAPGFDPSYF